MYLTSENQDVIQQVDICKMLNYATFSLQNEKFFKTNQFKLWLDSSNLFEGSSKFIWQMFNTLAQTHADYCSQLSTPLEGWRTRKARRDSDDLYFKNTLCSASELLAET